MPNPQRGEVGAVLDGRPRTLCLTLGALAALEAALDVPDLMALAARFDGGRPRSADIIAVIGAGLRGAGGGETDAEVAAMAFEGGVAGAARLAASLLTAAFAPPS